MLGGIVTGFAMETLRAVGDWLINADNRGIIAVGVSIVSLLWTIFAGVWLTEWQRRRREDEERKRKEQERNEDEERKIKKKRGPLAQSSASALAPNVTRRPLRVHTVVATVVAVWAVGLGMFTTTWWLWDTLAVVKPPLVSYVCRSENGNQCPGNANLVGCADATPAIEAAGKNCKSFNVRIIMNSAGGQCGHTAWELTCTK